MHATGPLPMPCTPPGMYGAAAVTEELPALCAGPAGAGWAVIGLGGGCTCACFGREEKQWHDLNQQRIGLVATTVMHLANR